MGDRGKSILKVNTIAAKQKKTSHETKTLSVYFQIEALSIFCLFDDDGDL